MNLYRIGLATFLMGALACTSGAVPLPARVGTSTASDPDRVEQAANDPKRREQLRVFAGPDAVDLATGSPSDLARHPRHPATVRRSPHSNRAAST